MDCGGAADRCHFALPRSRDSAAATATRRSSAAAARHALAGICVGLLMRHPVVCRTCYWIFDTMHRYGGLPIPAAMLALGLSLYVRGLYHGCSGCCWLGRRIIRGSRVDLVVRRALVAAPFFGLPWNWLEHGLRRFRGSFWDIRRPRILRSRELPRSPACMGFRLKFCW